MPRIILTQVSYLACVLSVFGQSISSSVIAMAGGYEKIPSGVTVNWTVGEPVVDPLRSGNVVFTQGFHQPKLRVSTSFTNPNFTIKLKVFPNPTQQFLYIQGDVLESLQYRLTDISGKVIREGYWNQGFSLNVSGLSQGMYALYFSHTGRLIQSEIISKH